MSSPAPRRYRHRFPAVSRLSRHAGFTLVELLVTMTVAAILVGLAAPSFSNLIASQRAKSAATDLYIFLTKARSEALKRNTSVTLSPATAGAWDGGWHILDPDNSAVKLHDHDAVRNVSITGPDSVTYRSSGRIAGTDESVFDITASGVTTHWCLSIDLSGRPNTTKKDASC